MGGLQLLGSNAEKWSDNQSKKYFMHIGHG